jgi:predicted nucleic acid-binding Zn ribbon protein|tara:strand:+ start:775 stop:915 length:141 start_codon:yes stop_codon:yes gene_type:complete
MVNERILKLKGEWRLKKKKRFRKKAINWVLMIALIGAAIWVYLNWM